MVDFAQLIQTSFFCDPEADFAAHFKFEFS